MKKLIVLSPLFCQFINCLGQAVTPQLISKGIVSAGACPTLGPQKIYEGQRISNVQRNIARSANAEDLG
jgi:hypothetical protein